MRPYEPLTYPDDPALLERVSRLLHEVYQREARRQAEMGADLVRHPDDYDDLPEHTKDYDRALALYLIDIGNRHDRLFRRIADTAREALDLL